MRVNPVSPAEQLDLNFGDAQSRQERESKPRDPGKAAIVDVSDKAKSKVAEGEYFKDQRTPRSPLIAEAEIAKMKEILNKPKGGGSGGGGMGTGKMSRDITKNYKAGGRVSSASKRADGCAVKGKTRGRMV